MHVGCGGAGDGRGDPASPEGEAEGEEQQAVRQRFRFDALEEPFPADQRLAGHHEHHNDEQRVPHRQPQRREEVGEAGRVEDRHEDASDRMRAVVPQQMHGESQQVQRNESGVGRVERRRKLGELLRREGAVRQLEVLFLVANPRSGPELQHQQCGEAGEQG
jgi:hypothetical protein